MKEQLKQIWTWLFLCIILLINVAELGGFVHHLVAHQHEITHHESSTTEDEHKDCDHKEHISKDIAPTHICDGHFINLMPQVSYKQALFNFKERVLFKEKEQIFLTVQQYSSSYQYLFTSRPPPVLS